MPSLAAQDSNLCELKLEGKFIQYIVLIDENNKGQTLNQSEESINLPEGTYRVGQIHLQGGYVNYNYKRREITLTKDKPATLKIGGPLKQTLDVQRQGTILKLDYKLVGIGDESYTQNDRTKPPQFAIYNGDKQIAAGQFQFG